jgi:AraC family transcriptional regulator
MLAEQELHWCVPISPALLRCPGIVSSTFAGIVGSVRSISWAGGGATARMIKSLSGSAEMKCGSVELWFALRSVHLRGEVRTGSGLRASGQTIRYGFVLPAGADVSFAKVHMRDCHLLSITLSSAFILRAAELEHMGTIDILESWDYRDPLGWQIAHIVFEECESGAPMGLLYSETAATLLAMRLVRTSSNFAYGPAFARRGGLPPALLRRACDYMMSRLDENISLEEIAAVTELSIGHFSIAFKRSTGLSPYRWLRRQRIQFAKSLLARPELGLTEIALMAGYANQSALGVAFKRETGLTPTAWRWAHLS